MFGPKIEKFLKIFDFFLSNLKSLCIFTSFASNEKSYAGWEKQNGDFGKFIAVLGFGLENFGLSDFQDLL